MSKNAVGLAAGAFLAVIVCVFLAGASNQPGRPAVPVQVEVQQSDYGVEPAQSDTSKAIDMVERVAIQSQQATQDQLARMDAKLDKIIEKLASLEKQNSSLGRRLAAVEQRLGVVPATSAAPTSTQTPTPTSTAQVAQPTKLAN
jgi:hypothetical protein